MHFPIAAENENKCNMSRQEKMDVFKGQYNTGIVELNPFSYCKKIRKEVSNIKSMTTENN